MRFVSALFGQTLQNIPMDEIRPLSGYNYPGIINAVAARYGFINIPNNINEAIEKGMVFSNGTLLTHKGAIQINQMGIYNDGLLVTTSNTEDSDSLTDDLLQWGSQEFGLRPILTHLPRVYSSQVVVDFDISIDVFVNKFNAMGALISSAIRQGGGNEVDLHVARLTVMADPLTVRFPNQSTFYIEPRVGLPLTAQRYVSAAPLTTSAHLELLAAIEKLLK